MEPTNAPETSKPSDRGKTGRKCSPCQQNKCAGKYENRKTCEGNGWCACTCQESDDFTFFKAAGSILGGIACVAGGITLTIATGGIGAIAGGAILGAGTSMVSKGMSGERITAKDLATDIAISSTIGVLSGGIGAGSSLLTKAASPFVKGLAQVGAGAVSGAASNAVAETARVVQGEEVSRESVLKSLGTGAAFGLVGGVVGQCGNKLANSVAEKCSKGVTKVVSKVAVQTASATATDAGIQLLTEGRVDPKRLATNAASQLTVAATTEATVHKVTNSEWHAKRMNSKQIDELASKEASPQKAEALKRYLSEGLAEASKLLTPETFEEQMRKVDQKNRLQSETSQLNKHKKNLQKIRRNPNLTGAEKKELIIKYRTENDFSGKTQREMIQQVKETKRQIAEVRPDKLGSRNVHFLTGEHSNQVTVDIGNPEDGGRGPRRLILDVNVESGPKVTFSDYTENHDYKSAKTYGQNTYQKQFKEQVSERIAQQSRNSLYFGKHKKNEEGDNGEDEEDVDTDEDEGHRSKLDKNAEDVI